MPSRIHGCTYLLGGGVHPLHYVCILVKAGDNGLVTAMPFLFEKAFDCV